ncbi:MAG: sigma factor [Brevundimonas sp.]|uniref:RNA polymerase sigma factor n=1 Tax=Brevundimonas sp. TaxID=1871086 RepID=UPI002736D2EE|nr:sigma factor [Brevundimonas sp.]MDP3376857.1 sigma factor [Brevundimonas sp.]
MLPGNHGEAFPETSLTLVNHLRSADASLRWEAIRLVAARYWLPLYDYARRLPLTSHEAADAVQDFFYHVITHQESFAAFDAHQGKLRTWIVTIFRHRLTNMRVKQQALRRGGGAEHLPLDFDYAEMSYLQHAAEDALDPERAFDRAFARQLWQQVLESLRHSYALRHRTRHFAILSPLILTDFKDQPLTSRELAERAGLEDESQVKAVLHRLRKEAAYEFQRLVRLTVEGDDWKQEVRYLLDLVS